MATVLARSWFAPIVPASIRASLLVGLGMAATAQQAPDLLAVSVANESLYLVDGDTLTPTLLGNLGPVGVLSEIVRASTDHVYIFDRVTDNLLTVRICDGTIESVVHLDQDVVVKPRGFDVSPDGVLYGVFPGMELRTIDPQTGTTTFVTVVTGAAFLEAMAFSPTGVLYAAGTPSSVISDTLYTLDLGTGALTVVGSMGSFDVDTLTWAEDGFLYGAEPNGATPTHIYRIDPTSGSLVDLGETSVLEVNGLLAGPGIDDVNQDGSPDLCDCTTGNFCISSPNTVCPGAVIGPGGVPSISANLFFLRATCLPPGQPGIFYFGDFPQDPPTPFGNGWRCVGGNTVRLNPPLFADANGNVIRALDFSIPPANAFAPGETRYFQFWYRDHPQVGATFNLTDALAVTFCP